jgi:glycosyltransferase involved in cell wall biosynthesis
LCDVVNVALLSEQNRPLRIGFFTSTPLSVEQGSGTYVGISTLAEALRKLDVTVEIVAPSRLRPTPTVGRILFNETLRFRRSAEHDITVGFDLDGYRLAGRTRTPHIAAIKGVIADEMLQEKGLTRAGMAIQARCEALHVRRADHVVTTSQYSAGRIEQFYRPGKPVSVVPELIDLSRWRDLFTRARADRRSEKFVVLSVCRLYRRKRVDLLLAAAARLRLRIPGLEVRIAGDGPERGDLESQWRSLKLGEIVQWLGHVGREALAHEYRNADVFCLPSLQEGFGIVLLEAMAAGTPVVAARAAAMPEVAPQGMLVEPGSAEDLAAAIETLHGNPGLRVSLAAQGTSWVENFDAPRVARRFLEEIHSLVRPHGGPAADWGSTSKAHR